MLKLKHCIAALALAFAAPAFSQEPVNLDQLLQQLKEGKFAQSQANEEREARFRAQAEQQQQVLREAIAKRDQLEQASARLEGQFETNERDLAALEDALTQRMGSLKELFGVLQQVAGDTASNLRNSYVSVEFPGRSDALSDLAQKMGSSSKLASIEEIESVWFALQQEMTESGKVSQFNTQVTLANGEKETKPVIRVGTFNMVSDGKYLELIPGTDAVAELMRQPAGRYLNTAEALVESNDNPVRFGLDPTGGSILGLLVQAPDLQERIDQGSTVGYIILALGAVGLLIALERFVTLILMGGKVKRQLKNAQAQDDNPLGRVMAVKDKYPQADTETLELKLSEAILREVPKITRNLTFIKIISVVAPLLGLLGTVTGMINTFQAITLFGTGDPKLMAGGISQALVTTVLGLVVAIPMTLLFATLNTRSKNLVHVLQEQASGIIAERSERGH
ncbi:MotA/TolQ/ExbB proton channel family protein [Pseudidiomarina terrestris]|uniref:MotA/TolQ/ExbB proton channel family protein n=1 Tax=Pseudidiomarina terrestris TaxID=2820060 RepID=A0AAW7R3Q7_9GAMM|nr:MULTISPECIES: MotA/TolQ/ExbB proton channel family protein [unclassified Pseudidiomarina]MDN7125134.1 MotA/TolQ/ExbB proton channel family protein [Pseudidiomarina sp. 1APP75-32.1]MDN7129895.1 MotA/TolQ/ExbB proton channel family protein [Pseudidiomarina sp. 1APR75-15]MDN7136061.1 MotA/TolQ/ExbB proton channel family protein [Pseudidiomarina sp. 1ASP75-5]MDN7138414.1 MotA/TolQ/ExbB proton channel family protein [Pseudidiomarina sp. 1ASP75-14]